MEVKRVWALKSNGPEFKFWLSHIQAQPHTGSVTLDRLLSFSEPQFSISEMRMVV